MRPRMYRSLLAAAVIALLVAAPAQAGTERWRAQAIRDGIAVAETRYGPSPCPITWNVAEQAMDFYGHEIVAWGSGCDVLFDPGNYAEAGYDALCSLAERMVGAIRDVYRGPSVGLPNTLECREAMRRLTRPLQQHSDRLHRHCFRLEDLDRPRKRIDSCWTRHNRTERRLDALRGYPS